MIVIAVPFNNIPNDLNFKPDNKCLLLLGQITKVTEPFQLHYHGNLAHDWEL
jgi:hypothetical protein